MRRPRQATRSRTIACWAVLAALALACARRQPEPLRRTPSAQPAQAQSPLAALSAEPPTPVSPLPLPGPPAPSEIQFAVIGDYGFSGPDEAAVATLVKSWQPQFIITTGDNNYPDGAQETIDENIGRYFHDFISPYKGKFGPGAQVNRFFPSLGNHDWYTPGAEPYLDYFELPGNERYYEFVKGAVHFFVVDSDPHEPDGIDVASKQAAWLKSRMTKSTSRWQVVYMHHAPYSSGRHGPTAPLQWPYEQWGADLVLAGHDHTYERLVVRGIPYLVIGLGGRSLYPFGRPHPATQFRYNEKCGALRVMANEQALVSRFTTVDGAVPDELRLPP